jgi:hypothetical protein
MRSLQLCWCLAVGFVAMEIPAYLKTVNIWCRIFSISRHKGKRYIEKGLFGSKKGNYELIEKMREL